MSIEGETGLETEIIRSVATLHFFSLACQVPGIPYPHERGPTTEYRLITCFRLNFLYVAAPEYACAISIKGT